MQGCYRLLQVCLWANSRGGFQLLAGKNYRVATNLPAACFKFVCGNLTRGILASVEKNYRVAINFACRPL